MTRHSWNQYESVGTKIADRLESKWETPEEFINICKQKTKKDSSKDTLQVPTYVTLRPVMLQDVEGIGYKTSNNIIDEMVRDLEV